MSESFLIIGSAVDAREWQRSLDRFIATTGQQAGRAVRSEARTVLKLLYRFTPPQAGQAQGEGAVVRDVNRIFSGKPASYLQFLKTEANSSRIVKQVLRRKDGTPYVVDRVTIDLTGQDMEAFHARQRLSNGTVSVAGLADPVTGRWKAAEEMWVPPETLAAYLEIVKRRVGLSRSGWLPAMDAIGVPAEPWVTRHRGSGGTVENRLSDPVAPRFIAGNDLGFFRTGTGGEQVVERVFRSRREQLERAIDKALEDGARQSGLA